MIVDCAYYLDGHRSDVGPMSLQEAAARSGEGGFVWLGLFEPDEQELTDVRHIFGLHELAVEDAQNMHMRPKIDIYDKDVELIILRTARYDDDAEEVEFGEISLFLSPTFVIAVRQGVASDLRAARQRLEQRPELLAAGSSSALWAIMDQVVDGYAPVVAGLEHDIDQIEATVFTGAIAPTGDHVTIDPHVCAGCGKGHRARLHQQREIEQHHRAVSASGALQAEARAAARAIPVPGRLRAARAAVRGHPTP